MMATRSRISQLQNEIHARMARRGSLDDVEGELIAPSGLSDDQKAALWLYAWSHLPRRTQLRSAKRYLRVVTLS